MASLLPFNPMPTHVWPAALPSMCGQRHPCPCGASGAPRCVRPSCLCAAGGPPARVRPSRPPPCGFQSSFLRCRSVAQLCPTLCDPMDCSTPDLPVLHHLLKFAQTHVHRVGDTIQPSHPLLSPSPAFNLSQHQGLFHNESALCIRWPKHWSVSFSINPSNENIQG